MTPSLATTCVVTKIRVRPGVDAPFAAWQAKVHEAIVTVPGFVSLEILSPKELRGKQWIIVERLTEEEKLVEWRNSEKRRQLFLELRAFLSDGQNAVVEIPISAFNQSGGVTEIFVTEVNPEKEMLYREWMAKIHQAEAKFPGFLGVYVQSPCLGKGKSWITLLQFDTQEHLDAWLLSEERKAALQEFDSIVSVCDRHRVISPYAGWFSSIFHDARAPAIWKEAMIVLLVLFPIVMLQVRFLQPWLTGLHPALAMFISNVISVSLVTWPGVPFALFALKWWFSPKPHQQRLMTALGTAVVLMLYALEVLLFMAY